MEESEDFVLCSQCFNDRGLVMDAERIGLEATGPCPTCSASGGMKLTRELGHELAHRFFVAGTIHRTTYGGAPVIQFNDRVGQSDQFGHGLDRDVQVFEEALGIGFFHYGPHLWMVGDIGPLQDLQDEKKRAPVVGRILAEYPDLEFPAGERFYRLRKNPRMPSDSGEYDSPPPDLLGSGRFDAPDLPVLYGSQDLELCLHECRVTAEDQLYVATLVPARELRLLDLTHLLEEDGTEFDSLDIAVHMLHLAGRHSYEITRDLARAARREEYDGLVFPSYFSLLRTGSLRFETAWGISVRKLDSLKPRAASQVVPNIALFGRPVVNGLAQVECINKVVMRRVEYDIHFGPVSA